MLRSFFFGLVALTLVAGLGCYTLIRHPATDQTDLEQSMDKTCSDCHTETDAHDWTDPYYTSFYGFYSSPWQSYYSHPWWHEKWWVESPAADGTAPVTGQRSAWDRGPGAPKMAPVGGSYAATPGSGVQPAAHDTTRTTKPEPAKVEKKDQEPRRNAWTR